MESRNGTGPDSVGSGTWHSGPRIEGCYLSVGVGVGVGV